MFKKVTSVLGTFALICFSFYYTDSAIDLVRKTDPIMKEIVNYSNDYGNTSLESTLVNNNIIPGLKGMAVDIDASYNNMKRLGKFDKSLIVFEEVLPTISITNNYDNYIISGNKQKNNVSLVFKVDDGSYIEEIIKILNNKNTLATFFLSSNFFDNSTDLVKMLLLSGHEVEFLDEKYDVSDIKKYNSIKKSLSKESFSFCYTELKDSTLISSCKKEKMHTIIPSIIADNFPYNEVKHSLENGSIISFLNNKDTVRELPSIINYIRQKGKNPVILEKLLEE